jgi:hypothetical protein
MWMIFARWISRRGIILLGAHWFKVGRWCRGHNVLGYLGRAALLKGISEDQKMNIVVLVRHAFASDIPARIAADGKGEQHLVN